MTYKLFSIIVFVFAISTNSIARVTPINQQETRHFDQAQIDSLKNTSDFDYETERFSSVDLFDVIMAWLWYNILRHLISPESAGYWQILAYILAVLAFLFILRNFMRSKLGPLFYKSLALNNDVNQLTEDDIYHVNLQDLFQQKVQEKQYRYAVRLLYLIALKNLADQKFIKWKTGKTNHDYLQEIDQMFYLDFAEITRLFEYTWYGDFKIDSDNFSAIRAQFDSFEKRFKAGI